MSRPAVCSEERFRELYMALGTKRTAQALGISPAAVSKRARRLGLPYSWYRGKAAA